MAARQQSKKGKELVTGTSSDSSELIVIDDGQCVLTIEGEIPGTRMQRAKCDGKRCVAITRSLEDAYQMHYTLTQCDHPNIMKSIGVWQDPKDKSKAYIVVTNVDNALCSLKKEELFCIENESLCGFSDLGFKVFREIFSAVKYVNDMYMGEATSSHVQRNSPIKLFPLMLRSNHIFISGKDHVMLGNFQMKLGDNYVRRNRKNVRQEVTREDIEAAHWKEVGLCLESLRGDTNYKLSAELRALVDFLKKEAVTYDDLLWQPGIWDATTKMGFVREIFWLLSEEQKDKNNVLFHHTARGRVLKEKSSLGLLPLMKLFSPPKDKNGMELPIKEDHLLDSVLFLRNKIVAHYDEEYPLFQGSKDEIGTTKETVERYVQKSKEDYMINLAKRIRELGWIARSPVMRDENDYMASFYKSKK